MPFKKTDKGPNGTYVLYDQLTEVYPDTEVIINHSSPSSKFKYNYTQGQAYFIVAPVVDLMDIELEAMKRFVDNGNVLFISTYFPDEGLMEWLGVEVERTINEKDSVSIYDFDKNVFSGFYLGDVLSAYIKEYDASSTDVEVIGRQGSRINCIRFRMGSGYVILHTQPYMLSNYHLIKKRTKAYSEILFSTMPGPFATIYWDEYLKRSDGGMSGVSSPLKFIMSQLPLRMAFWWALAGLLLLVLFSFKRRQRIIPVTTPLVNNSLDMARTVSDMYYFGRRNEVMAKKKIAHWFEFLRTRYNIFTTQSPDMFWNAVRLRSGMPNDRIAELKEMVALYRNGEHMIRDTDLIRLNNLIDSFYKS